MKRENLKKVSKRLGYFEKNAIAGGLVIVFVALLLTIIWFRKGLLIVGGEGSQVFLDPARYFHITRYLWKDTLGTGAAFPAGMQTSFSSILFNFLIFGLSLKFSTLFLQATFFALLLISGSLSMYKLTLTLVKGEHRLLSALLAGLFYMSNPYAMVSIWYRFLYPMMFMYAFLPLLLLLYVAGLERKKYYYALFVAIASLAFSHAFESPTNIVVAVLVPVSYLLFYVIRSRADVGEVLYAIRFSGAALILSVLFNTWWIFPFAKTATAFMSNLTSPGHNLEVLVKNSRYFTIPYASRLLSSTDLFAFKVWGAIFSSVPFQIISWAIPTFGLFALILRFRDRVVWYFAVLSLFVLFFAKGSNPPWGSMMINLFKLFPTFLGPFRNPFEKLGMILALGYAFLFGVGLSSLFYRLYHSGLLQERLQRGWAQKILAISVLTVVAVSVLGLYPWPMWSGKVFEKSRSKSFRTFYATVPYYYRLADEYISRREKKDHRLMHLPLVKESPVYVWRHGFEGVDPNYLLFGKPSVSRILWESHVDELLLQISSGMSSRQPWKSLSILNAKYLIIHNDIDLKSASLLVATNPADIKQGLKRISRMGGPGVNLMAQVRMVDDKVQRWDIRWGTSGSTLLKMDTKDTVSKNPSIRLEGPTDSHGTIGAGYSIPDLHRDWGSQGYLEVWLKSSQSGKVLVRMVDEQGNNLLWDGRIIKKYAIDSKHANRWVRLVIPFNLPASEVSGKLDFRKVHLVDIGLTQIKHRKKATFKIGKLLIIPGKAEEVQGIRYLKSFGKLELYSVDAQYLNSHIFAANKAAFFKDMSSFVEALGRETYDPRETVALLEGQPDGKLLPNSSQLRLSPGRKSRVVYRKVNAATYHMQIQSARTPFLLVFSETYSPDWKVYRGNISWLEALWKRPVEETKHWQVNGYANAWYLEERGSFPMTIYYWPLSLFYLGGIISGLTFIGCLGFLLFDWRRKWVLARK